MSEVELFNHCRRFVEDQSEGEWTDAIIDADARKMAALFRSIFAREDAA